MTWIAASIAYEQAAARRRSLAYERTAGSVFDDVDFEIFIAHVMNPQSPDDTVVFLSTTS